jgi:hypothetical protein
MILQRHILIFIFIDQLYVEVDSPYDDLFISQAQVIASVWMSGQDDSYVKPKL